MMRISDLIFFSFENLRRRKGRTILTVTGVVVGTCSIIVMVSLGIAINIGFEEMLAQWGDLTAVQIYNWNMQNSDVPPLTNEVLEEIEAVENVVTVSPLYQSQYINAQLQAGENGRYTANVAVVGMRTQAIEELGYTLTHGEFLHENDVPTKQGNTQILPVLAGEFTAYAFQDTKRQGADAFIWQGAIDINGKALQPFVNLQEERVTLTLSPPSEEGGSEINYILDISGMLVEDYSKNYVTSQGLLLDLDVLKAIEAQYARENKIKIDGESGYNEVIVKVDDVDNVSAVTEAIEEMGYSTYSLESERENMQGQSQMLQVILGALGGVSLFVAALSIANTMTMSIYERTKEIGIMKVLGCELPKIRNIFLLEAAMIGTVGGACGIVLSYTISFILNVSADFLPELSMGMMMSESSRISIIPPWLAGVALVLSVLIGVLAGAPPANRASKISALEAIRRE